MRSLLVVLALAVALASAALAFQPPVAPLVQAVPAGYSIAPAFQQTCTGTAARVEASAGQAYDDIAVWAGTSAGGPSAVAVFFGDSSVTTTNGMPLCSTTSCADVKASYRVKGLWCRTGGSSIPITAQVVQ